VNRFQFDAHERKASLILLAILSGVVGALMMVVAVKVTGLGTALVTPQAVQIPEVSPRVEQQVQPLIINNSEKSIIDVVNRVGPSVVMITTSTIVQSFDFFTGPEARSVQSLGSGVIFRSDGYILTNDHVVNGVPGARDKIMVFLSNRQYPSGKTFPARIIGTDPQTDLAVLKIDAQNLPVPAWGDSNQVMVGQTAIAIGNPLAENLKNTVTVGVISAKNRVLAINGNQQLRNMFQTDASINPGNSGGPLLDSSGNVVGINTAILANSQGIGFSIPSNTVKMVANQLISKGYVPRPGLGIIYIPLDPTSVSQLEEWSGARLPTDNGLLISKIIKGSPADLAGLRPGDIIISVNGKSIEGHEQVRDIIAKYPVGAVLKIEYYHGDEIKTISVKVGESKG
jgi:serine protease Do